MALDQWTDEQEITLLKAVVRWKPVGMHKHFRMLAIHSYMASQGAITSPTDTHTTIPGIWAKLSTLYNLPILDDREDSLLNHDLLLPDDETGDVELYSPFALPGNEYGAKMFARRLDPDGSRSPPDEEAGRPPSLRESTVADTDEPGSSPAPGGRRSGRKARTPAVMAAARGPRVSKLQHEIDGGGGGSSSRRTSKATSVNEDEAMEDAAEDADGADSDEGEESGEEDESGNARKRRKISSGKGSVGRGTGGGSARRSARKK